MARRPRSRATLQLALDWTEALRWEDLPHEVREELRDHLGQLLAHAADTARGGEAAPDE